MRKAIRRRVLVFAHRVLSVVLVFFFALNVVTSPIIAATPRAYADTSSGASSASAGPTSTDASPTIVRELVSQRTADSDSYLLSNGEIESHYSMDGPINYLDPTTNGYTPIDTALLDTNVSGRVVSTNRANRFHIQLPRLLTNDWVRIGSSEGTVSLRPVSTVLTQGAQVASGSVVATAPSVSDRTYPNAFSGASLAYESQATGLKESIVISAPTSASVFSFTLATEGLTPRQQSDGSIGLFSGQDTTPTYIIPRPCMMDSRMPHDENAYSDQVRYALSGSASPYRLDVVADASWLSDLARVYPVRIDPTVMTPDNCYDTFINSNKPTTNYESDTALWVGNGYSGYQLGEWHPTSTFDSDMSSKLAAGYQVAKSYAQLYAQDHNVWGNVFAVNRPQYYIPSTTTWNNPADHSWSIREASTNVTSLTWYNFDTTAIEQAWSQSSGLFKGLQFYCDSGVKISFATAQSSLHHPDLETWWAGTPTVTLKPPYGGSSTPSITIPGQGVSWNYAESLTSFGQVEYQIQVATSTAGPAVASSDVVSAASSDNLPTPPGGWNWCQTYYVRVAVASDPDNTYTPRLWSAWTAWTPFKPIPPAPAVQLTTPSVNTSSFSSPYAAWTYSESQGCSQSEYQAEIATCAIGPAIVTTDVASSATSVTLPAPTNGWRPDQTYYVHARVACRPDGVTSLWSGWTPWTAFTALTLPDSVGAVSVQTTPSTQWFTESPLNGGVDNSATQGRGSAALSWAPSAGASGYSVYLFDGNAYQLVGSTTTTTTWSSAGKGIYPSDSVIASLAAPYSSDPFLCGSVDLRDDPRALYAKTVGSSKGLPPSYYFKVIASNAQGTSPLSAAPTVTVTLQNRSLHSNSDPRHTTFDLGDIGNDVATARMDVGDVQLSTTDLLIDSYGPDTSLSRTYSSSTSSTAFFGPGWRFNFERCLSLDTTGATYVDADGDAHRFTKTSGGGYRAPVGDYESLIPTNSVPGFATAAYQLCFSDPRSYELFDATGGLLAEVDNNGNTTACQINRNGDGSVSSVAITPPNRQGSQIIFTPTGGGQANAVYTAGSVTRRVDYAYLSDGQGNATDTADFTFTDSAPGAAPTPGHRVTYVFANSRLARVTESQDATIAYQGGSSATWGVNYWPDARLSTIIQPAHNDAGDRASIAATYCTDAAGLAQAIVSQSGEVSGTVQLITQTFGINPDGTMAYETKPKAAGDSTATEIHTYSPAMDEISVTNPDNQTSTTSYDASGNVLTSTDELGHTTTNSYDGYGDLLQTTDGAGATTFYGYDPRGNQTSVQKPTATAPGLTSTTDQYDAYGRLNDELTAISFDASATGRAQQWRYIETLPVYSVNGAWGFSQPGQVLKMTRYITADGEWGVGSLDLGAGPGQSGFFTYSQATFDAVGNVLTSTDASHAVTTNTYDAAGRTISTSDPLGQSRTVHTYSGMGADIAQYETDDSSIVGYRRREVDPFGRVATETAYLTTGPTTSTAIPNSAVAHAYDGIGRELTVSDNTVAGRPAITNHDAGGNAIVDWPAGLSATQSVDPNFATQTRYDLEGRTTWERGPGLTTAPTSKIYNADGTVLSETAPDQTTTTFGYDAAGRVTSESKTATSGVTTTRSRYDAGGRLVSSWDENGNETDYAYDLAENQTSARAAGQPASTSTYDELGYLLSRRDADGVTANYIYDVTGRTLEQSIGGTKTFLPDGGGYGCYGYRYLGGQTTDSSYDAAGRVLSQSNQDGSSTLLRYDTFGRTAEETQTTRSGVVKHNLISYDSLSRVATSSDAITGVSTCLTYPAPMTIGTTIASIAYGGLTTAVQVDSAGYETARATTGIMAATRAVTQRDPANRVTSWMMGQFSQSRVFDAAGRVLSQWGSGFAGSGATASYAYGLDGRKQAVHLPATGPAGGSIDTTYTYTADGRVASVTGLGAGSFQYDSAGNVTTYTASTSLGTTSGVLAYEDGSRLAARYAPDDTSVLETYGYDPVQGYRLSQRRSTEASVNFTYTAQGGLETYQKPANVQGVAASISATYTYDAQGQRTHSQVTSSTSGVSYSTDTTWTYSGQALLCVDASQSVGASDTWRLRYLYDDEGQPYAGVYSSSLASATVFGIVCDDHGDVVALVDPAGVPFASYRYDPWGRPLSVSSPGGGSVGATLAVAIASRQPLRYAGYCYDPESQFYYCSERTYDPATMQWLQKDPAEADGEESAYQYCEGNPVTGIDPTGLDNPSQGAYYDPSGPQAGYNHIPPKSASDPGYWGNQHRIGFYWNAYSEVFDGAYSFAKLTKDKLWGPIKALFGLCMACHGGNSEALTEAGLTTYGPSMAFTTSQLDSPVKAVFRVKAAWHRRYERDHHKGGAIDQSYTWWGKWHHSAYIVEFEVPFHELLRLYKSGSRPTDWERSEAIRKAHIEANYTTKWNSQS